MDERWASRLTISPLPAALLQQFVNFVVMSHVSALPRAPSTSVLEESAVEATQFALATLESFPSLFERFDAGDAAVGALGVAVVARAAYAALSTTARSRSWPLLGWLSVLRSKRA